MSAVLLVEVIPIILLVKVYAVHQGLRRILGVRCTPSQERCGPQAEEVHVTARSEAARPESARRERLNRERVLHAAVALADEAGVGAVSMRRLGQELGVVPMALYKHVAGKDEL